MILEATNVSRVVPACEVTRIMWCAECVVSGMEVTGIVCVTNCVVRRRAVAGIVWRNTDCVVLHKVAGIVWCPGVAVTGFMCFQHQFILFLYLLEICKSCYRPSRALCNSCYDCKTMRSVLRYAIPDTERRRTMRFVTYAIPVTSGTETMRSAHYVILVTSDAEAMRLRVASSIIIRTRRNN